MLDWEDEARIESSSFVLVVRVVVGVVVWVLDYW